MFSAPEPVPPRAKFMAGFLNARPGELPALALSFGFFFCVLCAYYIVRPIRDETGVAYGTGFLGYAFTIILGVMLAAVPLMGWLVGHIARPRIVPIVYAFFIATLLVFWALLATGRSNIYVAGAFYIWVSVFSLFAVSLFWSFMSDVWHPDQAKRIYGIVSVGGTCGALCGPLLVQALIRHTGAANLLLVSGGFLLLSLGFHMALRRSAANPANGAAEAMPDGAGVLAGALNVWKSPYLFRIAMWTLAGNFFGLFFTQEQARIFGAAIPGHEERLIMLARIETAVSLLTMALEIFITGRLMQFIGVGRTIMIGPLFIAGALAAVAIGPGVAVIATIMVFMRALDYGLTGPAMRVLYTSVSPADKYRAQNFNDTVIYRGGNAASTWVFNGALRVIGEAAAPAIAIVGVPIAAAWVWLSLDLGGRHERKAAEPVTPPYTKGSMN